MMRLWLNPSSIFEPSTKVIACSTAVEIPDQVGNDGQFAFCGNLYTFASEGERVYEFAPFSLLKPSKLYQD